MPRIAIDAMGGDHAPGVVVRGTYRSATEHPDWGHILVGDENVVRGELESCGASLANINIVHSDQVIGMNEHPVEALRAKKRASLPMAVHLVQEGHADAVISAGNTGALVAASTLMLRTLPGVRRAGILTTVPTLKGRIAIMDVGANVNAKPTHLMQYAVMADIFYRNVISDKQVHVGLLSVGSEEGKGSVVIKETHALLQRCAVDFKGNVEGHEIFEGAVEVVVCDGLVGNIMLKTAEGLSEILIKMFMGHAQKFNLHTDERFQGTIKSLVKDIDWREVGGAALLGVNGVVVIAHGRSDERAIASGIRTAAGCSERQVNQKIIEALERESTKAGATN
jgi:glycerol-3-phosphate acyltransferase PlsX